MRVVLIHNPKAGASDQPGEADLTRMIRDAGHDVAARTADDLERIVAEATPDACDLVAIAGGDGTAGRIVKQLIGCGVPITFLPMGTANNIARSLGLADEPLERLIAGWDRAELRGIDVGEMTTPWGVQRFVEGVGVGLFTRTMLEIDAFDGLGHLETPQEKIAEALAMISARLQTFPARRLHLRLDDRDLSGDYLMLEAMNIRFVGPNLFVAPGCDPGDGLLDVVLVAERDRGRLLAHLASWRRGMLLAPVLPTHRGAHLRIAWHGSTLHVDDEIWPPAGEGEYAVPADLDLRAVRHALRVALPAVG